jgi:glycosyltransferase involved in cell wall biosynthesis
MTVALAAAGIDVTVATTDADGADRLELPADGEAFIDGVTYRYFARNAGTRYRFSWPLLRWLRHHVHEYDVVHVHGIWDWASLAGCRVAHRAHVPYVMRTLGMLDPWSLGEHAWKKAPYYRMIERPHLSHAAAIHVTSQSEADGLRRLGFDAARTRVVPLGVSTPAWARRTPEHRSDGAVRLLFLGRLHPKKGVHLLLDALAGVAHTDARWQLVIAGSGDAAYEASLRNQVRALGLAAHVEFVGAVTGDAKWRLFQQSELFVLPSSQENFGIAVAESVAVGLPVVISDQVAIADDVAREQIGVVLPLDVRTWTAALRDLAQSPGRRAAMSRRAIDAAGRLWSWNRTAHDLCALYDECVAPRAGMQRR